MVNLSISRTAAVSAEKVDQLAVCFRLSGAAVRLIRRHDEPLVLGLFITNRSSVAIDRCLEEFSSICGGLFNITRDGDGGWDHHECSLSEVLRSLIAKQPSHKRGIADFCLDTYVIEDLHEHVKANKDCAEAYAKLSVDLRDMLELGDDLRILVPIGQEYDKPEMKAQCDAELDAIPRG